MKHHKQKQPREKMIYSAYTSQVAVHCWGESGQELKNLETGAETEAAYWLAPAQLLFYIIQDPGVTES